MGSDPYRLDYAPPKVFQRELLEIVGYNDLCDVSHILEGTNTAITLRFLKVLI